MTSVTWLRRHETLLILTIVLLAFLVRLYRITNPVLDWHAWRQADTASVTREYVKHGLDPLHPTYQDVSNLPSGTDNPHGYRMVEFPLLNLATAGLLRTFPSLPLETTSRIISSLFSLLGLLALYGLVRDVSGRRVAVAASLAFALLPYSIYYSRVVLPEPALIALLLVSIFAFARWLHVHRISWYLASLLALTAAFLLKPYAVFYAPVFLGLAYLRYSWKLLYQPWLWFFAAVPILPLLWWRSWIAQYPEGIPGNVWLLNANHIRFKPAWFRWLFYERTGRLISGLLGLILIGANLFHLTRREVIVYGSWWLGMLLYLAVFATGNVQHDYYQVLLLPIIAITIGRGAVVLYQLLTGRTVTTIQLAVYAGWLALIAGFGTTMVLGWQASGFFPEKLAPELLLFGLACAGVFLLLWWRQRRGPFAPAIGLGAIALVGCGAWLVSWQYVGGYFNVNHWEFQRAGQAVQRLTPADALIIAPNMGDTQLLFQTDRKGWAIGGGIAQKISQGADYYLSANRDDETNQLLSGYQAVEQTPEYVLIDLHAPRSATASSPASPSARISPATTSAAPRPQRTRANQL